ncbi:DUF5677 domain-containing protein [Vibrio navarrensis]|uniref:DUF5677 domain-containing protein n=1 Tax=Vibrio navarrensis TaxID=29495 RepID=UPI00051DD25F|nr:DUF5677 domain-containing protein [Vibrio navarrensis]KGK12914.1 hypothetical protein EA24_18385 [Vibrio navarrensis]
MEQFKDMETKDGMLLWRECFNKHIEIIHANEIVVRNSDSDRLLKLYPLLAAILEDSISLDILASHSRVNQCYVISRALLERVINFSYLLYAPEQEYSSFVEYTKNKAARSLSRKIEIDGVEKVSLNFASNDYQLSEDYVRAVERFTSANGREIPRWTKLNIDKRADFLDQKSGKNLLLHVLAIYADASEALHGTLYGALFHLGVFNPRSDIRDQDSVDRQRYTNLSFLYFMASAALSTLLFCIKENGADLSEAYNEADLAFKLAAEESGLAAEARG